jgi:dTDP-4-dehydrorhamnose reductase
VAEGEVLILGAGGQLGTAFTRLVRGAVPVMRDQLDLEIATTDAIRRLYSRVAPSLVVNCAAYTAVDRAESEEDLATEINGHAVGRLARVASELGVPFVTYSTDYVFDGIAHAPYLESHPTDPINAYGRSKLVGERAALSADGRVLVVRTSWVISSTHRNFVTAILGRVVSGAALKVVDDQHGCPTIVDDLAIATMDAVERKATGLLHLTNQGMTTWFDLARSAVRLAGLDEDLVAPCSTADYPTPARRPAYSVLGSEVSERLALTPIPHWEDSIPQVVEGSLRLIGQL